MSDEQNKDGGAVEKVAPETVEGAGPAPWNGAEAVSDLQRAHTELQYAQVRLSDAVRSSLLEIVRHLDPAGTSHSLEHVRELLK